MRKRSSAKYIVSGFIIAILIALTICVALLIKTVPSGKPQIEIYSGSAEKYYDGTSLTNKECGISSGELQAGHSINFVIYGEQMEVGYSSNFVIAKITNEDGQDITNDYEITYDYGRLEIFEVIDLFITTKSFQKQYDGLPLVNGGPCEIEGLLPEHIIEDFQYTGSQTAIGSSANSMAPIKIIELDGDDVTKRYNIIYNFGTLTVYDSESSENVGGGGSTGENSGDDGSGSGSGGSGGGGGGSGGELKTGTWFRIKNDVNIETLYLRQDSKSYYTGKGEHGFNGDVRYYYGKDELNPNSYFAYTLKVNGVSKHRAEIELLDEKGEILPYFSYERLDSDVGPLQYGVDYYLYNYSSYNVNNLVPFISDSKYVAQELAYRNFVKNNYLEIDNSLKNLLLSLANQNGINSNSYTLIEDVANYIQNAAYYSYRWVTKNYPSDKDMVTYFLTEEKAGVCRHFAAAATMMYRALGIPARYTIGYAIPTTANEWVEWKGDGHAWVEVYIDGLGWVPVEVTGGNLEPSQDGGSGAGGSDQGGSGQGGSGEGDNGGNDNENSGEDSGGSNDGTGEDGNGQGGSGEGDNGDNDNENSGEDSDDSNDGIGEGGNGQGGSGEGGSGEGGTGEGGTDDDSNDSSDNEDEEKTPLTLKTTSKEKFYDGTALVGDKDAIQLEGLLKDGHEIIYEGFKSITNVGKQANAVKYKIVDANGVDVTSEYDIKTEYSYLTVKPRQLTIVTLDKKKVYDGSPLTSNELTSSGLINSHRIECDFIGEQTRPGSSANIITNVTIYDQNNNDVTANYVINYKFGRLEVTI